MITLTTVELWIETLFPLLITTELIPSKSVNALSPMLTLPVVTFPDTTLPSTVDCMS